MADYRVVDTQQLDADLTAVADEIRARTGDSAQLAWPDGYRLAIRSIEGGGGGDSGGGSSVDVQPLSVTANGTYTAPEGTAYSPVSVSVSVEASDFYTGTGTPAASFGSVGDFFFVTG